MYALVITGVCTHVKTRICICYHAFCIMMCMTSMCRCISLAVNMCLHVGMNMPLFFYSSCLNPYRQPEPGVWLCLGYVFRVNGFSRNTFLKRVNTLSRKEPLVSVLIQEGWTQRAEESRAGS